MTGTRTVQCRTCGGAGTVGAEGGGGRSREALLRRELAKSWHIIDRYEQFVGSIYETAGGAIAELAAGLDGKDREIARLKGMIADMGRELAAYRDGVGKEGEEGEEEKPAENAAENEIPAMTRDEYRRGAARYEEAIRGGSPADDAAVFAADAAAKNRGRKTGGQTGHRGSSRRGPVDDMMYFKLGLCDGCGRADMPVTKIIRKRIVDLGEARREKVTRMYVIEAGLCPGCGTLTVALTDAIPGTSFGPRLRAHVHTYRDGHATGGDIREFLRGLEGITLSDGAISACISAISKNLDGPVLAMPEEEPVAIDDGDLRTHRSPLPPSRMAGRQGGTEYGRLDAILTQRSTLWTSFMPQPVMVRIVERASMDPYAGTDETGNRVGSDGVQTSVAETPHTTQIRIIPHRDAATLQHIWGWMANRPAMRDGTTGYEWHTGEAGGSRSRCWVHVLRDAEESAMENGLGSPQHARHQALLATYRDARDVREAIIERAGGPLTCASQLGRVGRVSELAAYIDRQTRRLEGRISGILEKYPDDAVATTIRNALPDLLTALRVPGMDLHNNGLEQTIRDRVVVDRRRVAYPDMKGAYNFSVMRTVSATCRKNGVGICRATAMLAEDPGWDIFNSGIPPPVFGRTGEAR